MKAVNNTNEITQQWKQAVCGTTEARARFVNTIMPKSASRPR
jgi:hypothetical protein